MEVVGLLHCELEELQRAGADLVGHAHAGLAAVRLKRLHKGQEPLRVVDLKLEVCHGALAPARSNLPELVGVSAEEVREFCVWRNAPMRVLSSQGDLVDSYDPALKEHRTVCFLAFDGHCYMYRAVKRVLERQAARVLYRGKARQTLPPSKSGGASTPRTCSRGCSGARTCGRRGASLWPPARAPRCAVLRAETGGAQDPRAAGGARGAAEVVQGAGAGVQGPALAGLAHEIFLKLLRAKRDARRGREAEDPGRAERARCAAAG